MSEHGVSIGKSPEESFAQSGFVCFAQTGSQAWRLTPQSALEAKASSIAVSCSATATGNRAYSRGDDGSRLTSSTRTSFPCAALHCGRILRKSLLPIDCMPAASPHKRSCWHERLSHEAMSRLLSRTNSRPVKLQAKWLATHRLPHLAFAQ
jgi:hypothetical protein